MGENREAQHCGKRKAVYLTLTSNSMEVGQRKSGKGEKIALAFVVWTLEGMGGSEKVVFDIARRLDKERYRIIVIALRDGPVRRAYERVGASVRLVCGPSRVHTLRRMRRILVNEKVHIINPHHFGPLLNSYVAGYGLGLKYFYTEHSRWQLEQLPLPWKMVSTSIVKRIDGVIALSHQIEEHYAKKIGLDPARIHVIPNGVDCRSREGAEVRELRGKIGIGRDEKVIGTVAHMRPEKNHKLLIKAFGMLLRRGLQARLVLVGRDFMGGEIERFAASRGVSERVCFLGEVENAVGLMQLFDVFCLPSLFEGMPLTILEAMASSVAVVGSDALGINEIVTHGRTGLLFENDNAVDLADRLEEILTDDVLRKRLSTAGRDYVVQHYSLDDSIAAYDRLFRSLPSGARIKDQ